MSNRPRYDPYDPYAYDEYDEYDPIAWKRAVALVVFPMIIISVGVGAALGFLAKDWLPGLGDSLFGTSPEGYFQLSRSSGLAAYGLLWLSMMVGLLITNRLARLWPGGPEAFELHRYLSLLSLSFTIFHMLVLLGDPHIKYRLAPILVPFGIGFRRGWVGVGHICFYLLVPVILSFYARRWIGRRTWRAVHFLTFVVFALALVHSVFSGPDTDLPWVGWFYWITGGSVGVLAVCRLALAILVKKPVSVGRKPKAVGN